MSADIFHGAMKAIAAAVKWIDYNRGTAIGIVLVLGMGTYLVGCQPKTLWEGSEVTAVELEIDLVELEGAYNIAIARLESVYQAKLGQADVAVADLAMKEAQRQKLRELVDTLGPAILSGDMTAKNAFGTMMALTGIFVGGGMGIDNIRKRLVLAAQRKKIKNLEAGTTT